MSQTNESTAKNAKYDAWIAAQTAKSGRVCTSDETKSAPQSQIHSLLDEGRDLMNELSEEIDRAFRQFEPVLMPISPDNTGPGEQIVPQPIQSEIGDLLSGRNRAMRSLIGQLRSINNRSTVAP